MVAAYIRVGATSLPLGADRHERVESPHAPTIPALPRRVYLIRERGTSGGPLARCG